MAIIAAYYGLPTLSMRAAVFHQMLRNQYGYRVRVKAINIAVGVAYSSLKQVAGVDGRCGTTCLTCLKTGWCLKHDAG